jgi:hypothetical protein
MARPIKKFKSLDDDIVESVIIPIDDTIENDTDESLEIEKDSMVADGIHGDDDIQLSNNDEIIINSSRLSAPPPKHWADGTKTTYSIGDIVYIRNYPNIIYKVIGPCFIKNTYVLKASGSDGKRTNIPESIIIRANSDAKWVDFWDTVKDPYRDWLRKKNEVTEVVECKKASKKQTVKKEKNQRINEK